MRTGVVAITVIGAALLVGCRTQPVSDVPDVPPPEPAVNFGPVDFEPAPGPSWPTPGPDPGPATLDTGTGIEEPTDSGPVPVRMHVVAKGDTLWRIAVKYYGDGRKWRDIANANGISNPQKLPVGKKLVVP